GFGELRAHRGCGPVGIEREGRFERCSHGLSTPRGKDASMRVGKTGGRNENRTDENYCWQADWNGRACLGGGSVRNHPRRVPLGPITSFDSSRTAGRFLINVRSSRN